MVVSKVCLICLQLLGFSSWLPVVSLLSWHQSTAHRRGMRNWVSPAVCSTQHTVVFSILCDRHFRIKWLPGSYDSPSPLLPKPLESIAHHYLRAELNSQSKAQLLLNVNHSCTMGRSDTPKRKHIRFRGCSLSSELQWKILPVFELALLCASRHYLPTLLPLPKHHLQLFSDTALYGPGTQAHSSILSCPC